MRIQIVVSLAVALVALGISAGCVAPEEYQSVDPQGAEGGEDAECEIPYITMHYVSPEPIADEQVRDAFIEAGYEWEVAQEGVAWAQLEAGDSLVVIAYDPGTSGETLIVSVVGTDPGVSESQVTLAANAADEVVMQAFPNLTAEERIESVWSATCGAPPDPVAIGRANGAEAGVTEGPSTAGEFDYATDAGEPRDISTPA